MVEIRKATKKDVPELKRIDQFGKELNRYSGLDKLDPNFKEDKNEKSYHEEFILGKKKWCLVAEENNKILGFVVFKIEKRPEYFKIKRVGYIELLYVDKKARGRGVSKLLMKEAREILKKEGIKYLRLSVHTDNPAKEVWEKQGFKEYRVDMWRRL